MNSPDRPTRKIGRYEMMVVGSELSGPVILGAVLDISLGWLPWGTLVGVFLGMAICTTHLIRLIQQSDESK